MTDDENTQVENNDNEPAATETELEAVVRHLESLTAPTYDEWVEAAEPLWSEVLPGLWQGGIDDDDTVGSPRGGWGGPSVGISPADFDFVTTLYAGANPVDWFVREVRFGIYDADIKSIDLDELLGVVEQTHRAWQAGKRVLVRCQAGWNRSGLVTALVLMREGFSADEAIQLLRTKRSPWALCNAEFEHWLRTEADVYLPSPSQNPLLGSR